MSAIATVADPPHNPPLTVEAKVGKAQKVHISLDELTVKKLDDMTEMRGNSRGSGRSELIQRALDLSIELLWRESEEIAGIRGETERTAQERIRRLTEESERE